jgi:pSer/pThr/pTyr-binding forkhead associated (FHA) protein
VEGDIRIPHDLQMSGRHAEIVRQKSGSGYRWHLVDLESTNGTFVRIGSTLLRDGNEFLVGSGRFRFEMGGGAPGAGADIPQPMAQATAAWAGNPVRSLVPSVVELSPGGPVNRHLLTRPEYWIGRDPQACPINRPDDLLTNPKHARLYRDAKGAWHLENNHSLNGLWLRVQEMALGPACQFRLGEQRFIFRILVGP